MQRMIMFVLAAVVCASAAVSEEPLLSFENYTCEGGHFRAQVPSGWTRSQGSAPFADMTRVAGARFDGPATDEGVPASVALYWYSGEEVFTTTESYINAHLDSMVREDVERGRVTERVQVAGRKATGFRIKTYEMVMKQHLRPGADKDDGPRVYERMPPSTTKKVILDDRYIVLPASKGYFVLHYRAPESAASRYQAVFDKVTASFEPLDKR